MYLLYKQYNPSFWVKTLFEILYAQLAQEFSERESPKWETSNPWWEAKEGERPQSEMLPYPQLSPSTFHYPPYPHITPSISPQSTTTYLKHKGRSTTRYLRRVNIFQPLREERNAIHVHCSCTYHRSTARATLHHAFHIIPIPTWLAYSPSLWGGSFYCKIGTYFKHHRPVGRIDSSLPARPRLQNWVWFLQAERGKSWIPSLVAYFSCIWLKVLSIIVSESLVPWNL